MVTELTNTHGVKSKILIECFPCEGLNEFYWDLIILILLIASNFYLHLIKDYKMSNSTLSNHLWSYVSQDFMEGPSAEGPYQCLTNQSVPAVITASITFQPNWLNWLDRDACSWPSHLSHNPWWIRRPLQASSMLEWQWLSRFEVWILGLDLRSGFSG